MNLLIRAISAIIAVLILVTTLSLWNLTGAIILIGIVAALISTEITFLFSKSKFHATSLAVLTALALGIYFFTSDILLSILPHFFGIILIPWIQRNQSTDVSYRSFVTHLLTLLYCFISPVFIFEILKADSSYVLFYFFGLLVFGIDTFAYFFGNLLGKKIFNFPYQPVISPSKTFEGFFGSLLWPVLICTIACVLGLIDFSALSVVFIALTSFAAISGDLMASLIKRKSKKKDSSQLMPGHGGLLDRLDSLLLSAPFFLIATRYLSL